MQLGLNGKVAIVIGSTRGIGKAVAASLLNEGASVVINSKHGEDVESVVKEFKKQHGERLIGIDKSRLFTGESLRFIGGSHKCRVARIYRNTGCCGDDEKECFGTGYGYRGLY